MTAQTNRFAGTIKILRFNIGLYAASGAALIIAALIFISHLGPAWFRAMLMAFAGLIVYWTLSSLLVSWWVYDRARVTAWQWLPSRLAVRPQNWVNIHSGFDESSSVLHTLFPTSSACIIDIYDRNTMTEPSIERARKLHPAQIEPISGRFDALPLPDADCDTVFLLMAAHEVRSESGRQALFAEVHRILAPGGQLVLVEHLRDGNNFLAFGPGFLHFFPAATWKRILSTSGLALEREQCITPFVRCFVARKESP